LKEFKFPLKGKKEGPRLTEMVKLYNHPEVSQMVSPFERTDSEGIQAEKKQIELLEQYLEKKR